MNKYQQDILEIAKAVMLEFPGTTHQNALRYAADIYRNRGVYKVTSEEKQLIDVKTPWHELPEHVRDKSKKEEKLRPNEKKQEESYQQHIL